LRVRVKLKARVRLRLRLKAEAEGKGEGEGGGEAEGGRRSPWPSPPAANPSDPSSPRPALGARAGARAGLGQG